MDDCTSLTVSFGTLVSLTVFSFARIVFILMPHCSRSTRFESSITRGKWRIFHRRLAVLHYGFLAPLFEVFVTWGATIFGEQAIVPLAAEVELSWLAVLIGTCVILVVAALTRTSYRMMVYTVQIMELPCTTAFFCERAVNANFGGETVIVVALLICSIVEVFTVPDFFVNYFPQNVQVARPDSANELHTQNMLPTLAERSEDVREADESFELAELSTTRMLKDLFEMIRTANPPVMKTTEMREFIAHCQKKLADIVRTQEHVTRNESPRQLSPRENSEYVYTVSPRVLQGVSSFQTIPLGLNDRYQRRSVNLMQPEC